MQRIEKTYDEAKPLINEADVLLFRGGGLASKIIGIASESPYTHVAVASWVNGRSNTPDGILECVEFKEGSFIASFFNKSAGGGGRTVNLGQRVSEQSGKIDVYRPVPRATKWVYNEENNTFDLHTTDLNPRQVTDTMRRMTGLPYGWRRIWWIAKHKLAAFRIFSDVDSLIVDDLEDLIYPVCSTTVAYAFNKSDYDLMNNRSDEWTEPGDVARSSRLSYLFTLTI